MTPVGWITVPSVVFFLQQTTQTTTLTTHNTMRPTIPPTMAPMIVPTDLKRKEHQITCNAWTLSWWHHIPLSGCDVLLSNVVCFCLAMISYGHNVMWYCHDMMCYFKIWCAFVKIWCAIVMIWCAIVMRCAFVMRCDFRIMWYAFVLFVCFFYLGSSSHWWCDVFFYDGKLSWCYELLSLCHVLLAWYSVLLLLNRVILSLYNIYEGLSKNS